uniref:Ycf45 n=1 Tax=Thalassionema nitzschioides TaxID=33649 RepID=UPI001EDDB5D8|nr:Ycf45 [Thalassionema nitzschioides]UHY40729.1 Ycf45 [Thalassionema nitzschioides]
MTDDLEKLFDKFPFFLYNILTNYSHKTQLIEIVLDLGRRPEARYPIGPEYLSQKVISWQDLDYITKRIGKFSNENRAGIERTLHRISCIRNRQFVITGLTCRVGRSIFGAIAIIRDLLESGYSILILGKPGVGKTTIIREIGRVLSDEMEKRVIIIDTSNEIGGDSDIPHSGIGRSRRMQVAMTESQHQIMIEAVENHMPQVIIIDEIGTNLEVLAARTIAEKGVQLIGTTHGNCLQNLIKNPALADLIGGIQYVTLSDDEAKRRKTQKTILERTSAPTFDIVVEMNQQNFWTIHEDVKISIDLLLRGEEYLEQVRFLSLLNDIQISSEQSSIQTGLSSSLDKSYLTNTWHTLNNSKNINKLQLKLKPLVIYCYSISTNLIKEVLLNMNIHFILTNEIKKASLIIGLKRYLKKNPNLIHIATSYNIPIYTFNCISYYQLVRLFSSMSHCEYEFET